MSNFRKVKDSNNYLVNDKGEIYSKRRIDSKGIPRGGFLLRSHMSKYGYIAVHLCNNGKETSCLVHRLVALAFIPNPENKPQVNHINGRKSDNRLENLEWVTRCENAAHAVRTGLKVYKGIGSGTAKLDDVKVRRIKTLLELGHSHPLIAQSFGVHVSTINRINTKQTWGHVG